MFIMTGDGKEICYAIKFTIKTTNNETKYEALLAGLTIAEVLGAREIDVQVDS